MSTSISIGRLVKSSSQVDYIGQVHGPADVASPPDPEDYAFATFVRIGLPAPEAQLPRAARRSRGGQVAAGLGYLVGLIHDTVLVNPEFGRLGPRLSPPADREVFSPDYLDERAVLVSILAVGQVAGDGRVRHGVPLPAAALGARVERLADDQVRHFHTLSDGLRVAYLPLLLSRREPAMPHLLLGVIARLADLFPDQARQLAVLRGNLAWKTTVVPWEH